MTDRERILQAIQRNKPALSPLPTLPQFESPEALIESFTSVATTGGTEVCVLAPGDDVAGFLRNRFSPERRVFSMVPAWGNGNVRPDDIAADKSVPIDVAILPGVLAVAENGAVWLSETEVGHRAVPFLAEHLVLVVSRSTFVWNMHEAYARIRITDTGYGVFIAGPSKTADIEQSLVIGAQGARQHTVVIV